MPYYTDAVRKAAERLVTDEMDLVGKTIERTTIHPYGPVDLHFTDGTVAVVVVVLDRDGDPEVFLSDEPTMDRLHNLGLITGMEQVQEYNARSLALYGKPIPLDATQWVFERDRARNLARGAGMDPSMNWYDAFEEAHGGMSPAECYGGKQL
jgi:hypothetical protein